MTYYADPQQDLPAPWKPKRMVFFAMGIKIYGQIPYILQRRLQAEFISNQAGMPGGGQIWWPAAESNYTLVRYRRRDGSRHSGKAIQSLLDWLYADKGFEYGVADEKYFYRDISHIGMWEWPPILRPISPAEQTIIQNLIEAEGISTGG